MGRARGEEKEVNLREHNGLVSSEGFKIKKAVREAAEGMLSSVRV